MQRIVQGRSATLTHTFLVAGNPADPSPDATMVEVRRADGTLLVSATSAQDVGTGRVSFALTPAHTAQLDTLVVTWTATFDGATQTFTDTVEVAGGLLMTIAQIRSAAGNSTLDESDAADARIYAETELERALRYALVPRYALRSVSTVRDRPLDLGPYVRSIRSVSVAGTPLTSDELALLTVDAGFVEGYRWPTGAVVVGYEHGLDSPLPGATKAALALAVDYLGGGGGGGTIDPRAESIVTVDGTVRLRTDGQFPTAGIDAWIEANRIPLAS